MENEQVAFSIESMCTGFLSSVPGPAVCLGSGQQACLWTPMDSGMLGQLGLKRPLVSGNWRALGCWATKWFIVEPGSYEFSNIKTILPGNAESCPFLMDTRKGQKASDHILSCWPHSSHSWTRGFWETAHPRQGMLGCQGVNRHFVWSFNIPQMKCACEMGKKRGKDYICQLGCHMLFWPEHSKNGDNSFLNENLCQLLISCLSLDKQEVSSWPGRV